MLELTIQYHVKIGNALYYQVTTMVAILIIIEKFTLFSRFPRDVVCDVVFVIVIVT